MIHLWRSCKHDLEQNRKSYCIHIKKRFLELSVHCVFNDIQVKFRFMMTFNRKLKRAFFHHSRLFRDLWRFPFWQILGMIVHLQHSFYIMRYTIHVVHTSYITIFSFHLHRHVLWLCRLPFLCCVLFVSVSLFDSNDLCLILLIHFLL